MASCTAHPLRRLALTCLALLVLGASPVLRADDHESHELARQALEQGRVLPLRTVLEKIERDYQGQALKVEFEQDDGRFLYKIRLLQSDGRMVKLKVDAVDGRVLETKRKEREKDRDAHPRR
ncbi:MAG: PepSY domain-containing protein [Giesbergeria sp.]